MKWRMWLQAALWLTLSTGLADAQPRNSSRPPSGPFTPEPAIRPSAPFPEAKQRHPPSDVYLAVQYGFHSTEVLYLYLSARRANEVRDQLQIFAPRNGAFELIDSPAGKLATFPLKGGSGTIRGREFRIQNLESKFDGVTFRTDLTVTSGYRLWDVIHVSAEVTMQSQTGRAAYRVGGLVHSYVGLSPMEAKPFAVVGMPRFRIGPGKFDVGRLYASLTLGDLPVLPGDGMGREVRASIKEAGSDRVRTTRARWEDRPYLGIRPFETLALLEFDARSGKEYEVEASLDLGPVFGTATAHTRFTAPIPKKSD